MLDHWKDPPLQDRVDRTVALPITHIHTYLVYPAKGVAQAPAIGGSTLPMSGEMFRLLSGIYERAENECKVAIAFTYGANGEQTNECRDLLLDYVGAPHLTKGRRIAERLAAHTDNRPRMGLLFLIRGTEGSEKKVIVSRFPADSGILAEQEGGRLNVAFLERIFMKSAKSYKAVVYRHRSLDTGFWQGLAIDRQMNDADSNVSGYWINDFLKSDFLTTSAAGTRRLAIACRNAARKANSTTLKTEIVAAVTLAGGQDGQRLTTRNFVERLGLTEAASAAIIAEMKPHLADEIFQFNAAEFGRHVTYRSVELDNGGIMTAATEEWDQVFITQGIDEEANRYTTEGKVVGERLGKVLR